MKGFEILIGLCGNVSNVAWQVPTLEKTLRMNFVQSRPRVSSLGVSAKFMGQINNSQLTFSNPSPEEVQYQER
jgi:hypothetical protein